MSDYAPATEVEVKSAKKPITRYARYVFLVLFLISMFNNMDRYILNGAANVMARELGLGIEQIGYLSSAFLIFYTLSVIPLGIWSDRAKRKNVIATAVAIWSLATGFTALATNFVTLFLSRMVLGVGEAGYSPSSQAMMSDYFGRARRAKVMSWWAISTLVGLMIGVILGGYIADLYFGSWRLAFLFAAVPGLILAFIAWRMREPRRNEADEEADGASTPLERAAEIEANGLALPKNIFAQFGTLLRVKTLMVLTIMQVFTFFVISGTVTFLSIFLQQKDTLGLTSTQAGLYTGIGIVLAGCVGVILGGYLSDWLNRHYAGARVLICGLGYLLSAPTYLLSVLVAVNMHNLPLYTVFFTITTILLNVNSGPASAAVQDVVPTALRGSAVALSLFIGHILGDAFAPSLVGALARSFDPSGQHFAQGMAGHDLTLALIYTYPTSLIVAGLIGIIGSRWVRQDMERASQVDRLSTTLS